MVKVKSIVRMRERASPVQKNMEERIQQQQGDKQLQEVEELNLDNVCAAQISGLTQDFTSLKHLSIINTGLTTLDTFPALRGLERLELGDNKLSGDLKVLGECPSLRHLSLAGNRITNLETLKPLCVLDHLTSLDLFNCPVTQQEDYRMLTFDLLPSLVYLDGVDREGHEALSGSEEEEEEEEEEVEEEESDEPGLEYLQRELGSESSEDSEEYDPNKEEEQGLPEDEDVELSDEEEEQEGPSSSKRPRLDPDPLIQASSDSD